MTCGEDEAEQVVSDVVVDRTIEIHLLLCFHPAAELFVLALEPLAAPEVIDRAALADGHEPRTGIVRDPGGGPLLQSRDERVVREVFCQADVSHHVRESGDEPRRFDPPDRVDRGVRFGSHHGYR